MSDQPLFGGWSDPKPATVEDQGICQMVKLDVEAKLLQKFHTYTTITVRTQVVAGIKYLVKILVDDEKHLHAHILSPLEGHVELGPVQYPKAKDDPLVTFDS